MPLDITAYEHITGRVPKVTVARRRALKKWHNSEAGHLNKAQHHTRKAWQQHLTKIQLSGQYDIATMFYALMEAYPRDSIEAVVLAIREHPSTIEDYPEETLENTVAMYREVEAHRPSEE